MEAGQGKFSSQRLRPMPFLKRMGFINTKARRHEDSKKGRTLDFKQAFEVFFVPLRLCAFVPSC